MKSYENGLRFMSWPSVASMKKKEEGKKKKKKKKIFYGGQTGKTNRYLHVL